MCTNFYLYWFRNKILFFDLSVSFSTLDLHCFAFIESLLIFQDFPGATTKSHDFPGLENEIIIFCYQTVKNYRNFIFSRPSSSLVLFNLTFFKSLRVTKQCLSFCLFNLFNMDPVFLGPDSVFSLSSSSTCLTFFSLTFFRSSKVTKVLETVFLFSWEILALDTGWN